MEAQKVTIVRHFVTFFFFFISGYLKVAICTLHIQNPGIALLLLRGVPFFAMVSGPLFGDDSYTLRALPLNTQLVFSVRFHKFFHTFRSFALFPFLAVSPP